MLFARSVRVPMHASLAAICLVPPWAVLAQTVPSQSQTPPGAEIERRSGDAQLDLRIGGMITAPPGSENIILTRATLNVDGGFAPVADAATSLLPAPGSTLSLADVYAAAARLQQAYFDAGYPLVRVFVPVQDLDRENPNIRLQVVSGYVSGVNTDALDRRVRSIVARYLETLVGEQNITAAQLERAVMLAGDVSGVQLASALSPGSRTGETMLIVSGDFEPVQAVLSADNRLSPELGREQATLSVAFNSMLGLGERIGATVATALDDPSLGSSALRRYFGAFADIPIGSDGLVIGGDASLSTARPAGAVAFLALASRFEHFGGRVSYPLVRNRRDRLIISASFDVNKETQDSRLLGFPVPLSRDQTRVGRISINGSRFSRNGLYLAGEIEYSRGFDILGARTAADASVFEPLSRIGADAVFNKLSGSLILEAPIPGTPIVNRMNIRGQTGFGDPMLRSEQLSIATPDLISGPPSGSLVGDSAIAARYQIEAVAYDSKVRLVPYGFLAAANAWLERPTLFELRKTSTHAYGAGVRGQMPIGRFLLSGTVEYSNTGSDDFNARGDWVTFQIAVRY